MESLPALGEERFAGELLRSPGGGAITAVGAARLGLSTAIAAPLGDDVAGDLVRAALAKDGVEVIGTRTAPRTPTTVVMPFGSDRAMVTVDPGVRASAADVAAGAPAGRRDEPRHPPCRSGGGEGVRHLRRRRGARVQGRPPAALAGARALFVNRGEALGLTGADRRGGAAALAELAESVVVSLGADGGIIATGGEVLAAAAERVEAPVDTTGAGDLLAAAYIWADLHGAEPLDRLRWATLYASLGVRMPTGIGGALTEAELIAAGTERGLQPPPLVGAARS